MQATPEEFTRPLPRMLIVPLKVLSAFVASVKEAETLQLLNFTLSAGGPGHHPRSF